MSLYPLRHFFHNVGVGAILLTAQNLPAQTDASDSEEGLVTFAVTLENDVFAGTDRNYTNGAHFLWDFTDAATFSTIDSLPEWAEKIAQNTPLEGGESLAKGASIALGQSIFTPSDISRSDLIEEDRPYAGWTYLNLNLRTARTGFQRTLGMTVGMIGPDSYAEDLQTWVHENIDSQIPQGWEHQLDNELGLILSYREDRLLWEATDSSNGWNSQITQSHGFSLGNVHTNIQIGGELRFGYNLTSSLNSPRIREAGVGGLPTSKEGLIGADPAFGLFLVFGGEGRGVLRNLFVEGNTFSESHGKEREDWVADGYLGATATLGSWSFSYLYTRRSRDFTEQERYHEYGALTVSHTF